MHCKELATYLNTVQTLLFTGTKARAKNIIVAISIFYCSSLLLVQFNHCHDLRSLFWMALQTWTVHTADYVIVHHSISVQASIT